MEKTDVGGGRQPFGTEQCAHLPRDAGGTTPLSSVVYVPQVYQRDLIYPHGDHGLGLGIHSYGGGLRLSYAVCTYPTSWIGHGLRLITQ